MVGHKLKHSQNSEQGLQDLVDDKGLAVAKPDTNLGATLYLEELISQDQAASAPPCKGYIALENGIHVTYAIASEVWKDTIFEKAAWLI